MLLLCCRRSYLPADSLVDEAARVEEEQFVTELDAMKKKSKPLQRTACRRR